MAIDGINNSRIPKCLLIINYIVILGYLCLVVRLEPFDNYVMSIYDQIPQYFWQITFLCIIISHVILQYQAAKKTKSNLWILSILSLILIDLVLLSLPVILDFFTYGRGDPLSHFGYVIDILNTGHFSLQDVYPGMHILLSVLVSVTLLPENYLLMLIPIYFSLLLILFMVVLGFKLFRQDKNFLIYVGIVTIPIFGYTHLEFAPYWQTLFLIPFVVFIIWKYVQTQRKHYLLIILIVALFINLSHPLISLLIIFLFLIFNFSRLAHSTSVVQNGYWQSIPLLAILLLAAIFLYWNIHFEVMTTHVGHFISFVRDTLPTNEFSKYMSRIEGTDRDTFFIVQVALNRFGIFFAFFGLTCATAIYYIYEKLKSGRNADFIQVYSLICSISMYSMSFVGLFTFVQFGIYRLFKLGFIFSLLLLPLALFSIIDERLGRTLYLESIKFIVYMLFTVSLVYLSMFSIYPDPINGMQNEQVTRSEYIGMGTILTLCDDNYEVIELGISSGRFNHALYGMTLSKQQNKLDYREKTPLDHFNYDNNPDIQNTYNRPTYFIDQRFESNILSDESERKRWVNRFNERDFILLNNDEIVRRIYDNGQLRSYLIME